MSIFSNNTDFKTEDMPDLMTLLRARQEESAASPVATKSSKKSKKLKGVTAEAVNRTKRMEDTLAWWNATYQRAEETKLDDIESLKLVMDW